MSFVRENIENLLAEHSDTYKEVFNFRPRLNLRWDEILADPEAFIDWIEMKLRGLRQEAAWVAEREERERSEFSSKVKALGLDPKKYIHLCLDY